MTFPSPLAAIHHVIQQVRANAAANTVLFCNNEAATRAALIDPILRALGWDTANVRMVEPERMVANKQSLDYVLKDADGNIRSVIEAKKLGESLDKIGHVGAVIGYAFSLKPKDFFITDGLNWHYYSPAHSNYQPVDTLNLHKANSIEAALWLIQRLDAAQSGYGLQPLNSDQLSSLSHESARPTLTPAKLSQPATKQHLKQKKPVDAPLEFIEISQLQLSNSYAGQKPKQLRLPNGTIKPIAAWKDILLEVCRLALFTNAHFPIPFPDKAGKKRLLISTEKQPIGASTRVSYNGGFVFIGTNYSKEDCIANAYYAAQQLPANQRITSLAVIF